jgi:2-aminoadipate transaminase
MKQMVQQTATRISESLNQSRGVELTPLQSALAVAADADVLSLAMGLPDPSLFPVSAIQEAVARVLSFSRSALQYTLPCETLKKKICSLMLDRGVDCSPDCIFLTSGAQQAISLVSTLLLSIGSSIVEEELSYPNFQCLVDSFRPQILRVPTNSTCGIDVDVVEKLLVKGVRPALIYVMATAHNPLGVTLSRDKRRRLALLAREFEVPIVEDDPYGALFYDIEPIPSLCSFDQQWIYYVGSFSKILCPSLRVGWVVAPEECIKPLSIIKEGCDLNISTFSQWIVNDFLDSENIVGHTELLRKVYRGKRDAMNAALEKHMPQNVHWEIPACGIFFWLDLPEHVNASALLSRCVSEEKVAFLPAEAFSRNKRSNGMRLNFSHRSIDQITEGVARIGRVLHR